jgi:hypothetical protein
MVEDIAMLVECIVVGALESASDITRQTELSAERARYGDYLTSKRYEIVTKSDVNWMTLPGDADATQLQIQDLPLGQRIATNRGVAVDRTYHCGQYLWVASWEAIQSLRKDVN